MRILKNMKTLKKYETWKIMKTNPVLLGRASGAFGVLKTLCDPKSFHKTFARASL